MTTLSIDRLISLLLRLVLEMAGGKSAKSNPSQARKRVDAVDSRAASVLVRAKDGSAFAKWFVSLSPFRVFLVRSFQDVGFALLRLCFFFLGVILISCTLF